MEREDPIGRMYSLDMCLFVERATALGDYQVKEACTLSWQSFVRSASTCGVAVCDPVFRLHRF
jgi:hypothetical protein